jgi:hypothetical protein
VLAARALATPDVVRVAVAVIDVFVAADVAPSENFDPAAVAVAVDTALADPCRVAAAMVPAAVVDVVAAAVACPVVLRRASPVAALEDSADASPAAERVADADAVAADDGAASPWRVTAAMTPFAVAALDDDALASPCSVTGPPPPSVSAIHSTAPISTDRLLDGLPPVALPRIDTRTSLPSAASDPPKVQLAVNICPVVLDTTPPTRRLS